VLALYARVSTLDQGPEAQLDELKAYANRRNEDSRIFVDHGISGTKDSRPALDELMERSRRREFSALVIVKLDRLARSVRHLTALAEEFDSLGVDLVVLDQAIDTGTATGKLLFHVLGAIGEFERTLIVERTKAGVAAARRRGRHPGRSRAAF
jgi:DNA invertase Pin-like site-specific DNA recombinase